MPTGEAYHAPNPGKFRILFSVEENTLKEGIKRSGSRLFACSRELRSRANCQIAEFRES